MRKSFIWALFLLSTFVHSAYADAGDTLYIQQSVSNTKQSTTSVTVGSLLTDLAGIKLDLKTKPGKRVEKNPPTLAMMNLSDGMSKDQILSAANSAVAISGLSLKNSLTSLLLSGQYRALVFTYTHAVTVAGDTDPSNVVWQIIVESGTGAKSARPKIMPGNPKLLVATYTSKYVMNGLPAGWKQPNAGMLTYKVIDSKGNLVKSDTTVDMGGFYDEAQPQSGSDVIDPDGGVKCLGIVSTKNCFNRAAGYVGTPDSKRLLNDPASSQGAAPDWGGWADLNALARQFNASTILLGYVRMVQPVYDEVQENGQTVLVARTALEYTQRIFTRQGYVKYGPMTCLDISGSGFPAESKGWARSKNGTYQNKGNYGFLLNAKTDLYVVAEDTVNKLNSVSIQYVSPTQAFDVTINTSLDYATSGYLIDPLSSTLQPQSYFKGLVNIAGLQVNDVDDSAYPPRLNPWGFVLGCSTPDNGATIYVGEVSKPFIFFDPIGCQNSPLTDTTVPYRIVYPPYGSPAYVDHHNGTAPFFDVIHVPYWPGSLPFEQANLSDGFYIDGAARIYKNDFSVVYSSPPSQIIWGCPPPPSDSP